MSLLLLPLSALNAAVAGGTIAAERAALQFVHITWKTAASFLGSSAVGTFTAGAYSMLTAGIISALTAMGINIPGWLKAENGITEIQETVFCDPHSGQY